MQDVVINNQLLIEGVEEPSLIDDQSTPDFSCVTSLRLSFQKIIDISNLNGFEQLTTLRLDNNNLHKIANMAQLLHLTWLDLSFNSISEIEGLDGLHSLTDLSLYHNQISQVKGLASCSKLDVLSLGQNKIRELKEIEELSHLQHLKSVRLDGNEVCGHASYTSHVLAYLPALTYLDHMLIDRKAAALARESYKLDERALAREKAEAQAAKEKAFKEKQSAAERAKENFVDCLEDLVDELLPLTTGSLPPCLFSGYQSLSEEFRKKALEDVKNTRQWFETANARRFKIVASFGEAVHGAEQECEELSVKMLDDFKSHLKRFHSNSLEQETNELVFSRREAMTKQLLQQLDGLENHLMTSEIHLEECLFDATSSWGTRVGTVVQQMTEAGADFFQQMQQLMAVFCSKMTEGSDDAVQEAVTDLLEGRRSLLARKDEVMRSSMSSWASSLALKHREAQREQNRRRTVSIKEVVEACRKEIAATPEAVASRGV